MTQVTKDQFYAALYADNRRIMPTIINSWSEETGYIQEWRTADRTLFGQTSGNRESTYELVEPLTPEQVGGKAKP